MSTQPSKSIEQQYGITDLNGKPYEIPVRGSMGLLMLGYRGLMAWRAKRIEAEEMRISKVERGEKGK